MAVAQDISNALVTITVAGSAARWMDWIATNSIALTVIIVFTTGVASQAISLWGKNRELKLSKERNDILRAQNKD